MTHRMESTKLQRKEPEKEDVRIYEKVKRGEFPHRRVVFGNFGGNVWGGTSVNKSRREKAIISRKGDNLQNCDERGALS